MLSPDLQKHRGNSCCNKGKGAKSDSFVLGVRELTLLSTEDLLKARKKTPMLNKRKMPDLQRHVFKPYSREPQKGPQESVAMSSGHNQSDRQGWRQKGQNGALRSQSLPEGTLIGPL